MATQLTATSVQPIHLERQEVNIVSEEEDKCKPVPLASKKVFDWAFWQLNSPADVYID